MPTLTALNAPTGSATTTNLAFLYPYDKTVWPRGMLAPLLMWSWAPLGGPAAPGDADAVQISLKTASGSFSWTGIFGQPGDPVDDAAAHHGDGLHPHAHPAGHLGHGHQHRVRARRMPSP